MLSKPKIISYSLGLILGLALAPMSVAESPEETAKPSNNFTRIEQPLPLKVGVTLGGLALIGCELWWFLFGKTKAKKAKADSGIQEIDITVDGGYEPDIILVEAGQALRVNFFRKDPSSCLETVIFPDFHKAVDLQLERTTSVEVTPEKPGKYIFHCGMNMFRGVVEVKGDRAEH